MTHWSLRSFLVAAIALLLAASPAGAAQKLVGKPGAAATPQTSATRDDGLAQRVEREWPRAASLIEAEAARLLPHRAGQHNLYMLAIAGWGDQQVFGKEVMRVTQLMEGRGVRGRVLRLSNAPATIGQVPMATPQSIAAALKAIGHAMDPKEDVLFLFATSHGAPRQGFALEVGRHIYDEILPDQLARMLDEAGIRQRVIVISACYSGQFVDALKSDDTIVITAASADRSSFGCTDRAEWTWFGEAYFVKALPAVKRFVQAFESARTIVADMEARENFQPSNPQISVGPHVAELVRSMGF